MDRDLVSYKDIMIFLSKKGKGKNWFDTMRTRYKVVPSPIITLVDKNKERSSQKRNIFYHRKILNVLSLLIYQHDSLGYTYTKAVALAKPKIDRLKGLQDIELFKLKLEKLYKLQADISHLVLEIKKEYLKIL